MPDQAEILPGEGQRRFLTFRMAKRLYALAAEDVSEVIRIPPAARVPQSPAALLGIANLRGTVLPLVSLRGLLGADEAEGMQSARAIVLANGASVALAVDSVEALITVESDRIETQQAELSTEDGERLKGAFPTGMGAAKILDIQTLLEAAFAERAKPQRQMHHGAATAQAADTRHADTDMLVTFDVAGQEYALSLDAVQEIVSAPDLRGHDGVTGMPRAEALVLGMMTFRDTLLPLLSLRGLLGFAAAEQSDGREKVVVAHVGGTLVGLVADRARAIVAAERDRIDPVPPVLSARVGGEAKINAIYRGEAGRRLISILAPDQLFREDVMRRLGAQQQTVAQPQAGVAVGAERKFLVFRLGKDEFGLPIEAVDEVARVPDQITRVPKTPKFLEGVVNLRGEVLPVVDQRKRFDMPKLEKGDNRRLIVVRTERHRAGLIVDSVSEVLRSEASAIEATPDLTEDTTRLVHGVINLEKDGRIVLLLDPAELLTRAERGLLDAFAAKARS